MRRFIMHRIALSLFMILTTVCICKAASPEEQARFEQAVRSAFDKQDLKLLENLTCWERVPQARREAKMKLYARDLKFGARTVKLTEPDPRSPDVAWTKDGVTYKSNLPVIKNVKITFNEGARFKNVTYFVGEKQGGLFLLAPAPVHE